LTAALNALLNALLVLFGVVVVGVVAGGCSVEYPQATFQVVEGVGELQVVGAFPNADARVVDAQNVRVARGTTDSSGGWTVTLAPGQGYRVKISSYAQSQQSRLVDVFAPADFLVREGIEELFVSGAIAGAALEVRDAAGDLVATGTADGQGSLTVSNLALDRKPYRVIDRAAGLASGELDVFAPAAFDVRESIEQIFITGALPGVTLEVRDALGVLVGTGVVDDQGSFVVRKLSADGKPYRVIDRAGGLASPEVNVTDIADSLPDPSFYSDQVLTEGFNYITMRDGTTLSAYVTFPKSQAPYRTQPPYPTLVSYSGYAPSKPGSPLDLGSALEPARGFLCNNSPTICDAPNHPAGLIGGLFGFATVGVNMRGTGCSGGAYDFFEPLQVLDGYDIIETVAAQSWVLHNKVGMAGLSYPGISQLFVAKTRPPGLAAITPLSVIANTATSVLAPGGIFNDGFAFQWGDQVFDQAGPYGQGWEADQVAVEAAMDPPVQTCADNQLLHDQRVDPIERALENDYYVPEIADELNPSLFADAIDVPVFLTGAWQDEQTGPHFATLLDKFVNAPVQRFTVFNGLHADGYSPETLSEWKAFNDIYVARERPSSPPLYNLVAPILYSGAFAEGDLDPGVTFVATPIPFSDRTAYPTLADAQAAFEAQPRVRVIFERGGEVDGAGDPLRIGMPSDGFVMNFASWPPPETQAWRLFLHADGSLREEAPPEPDDSASAFVHDPGAGQRTLGFRQPFYHGWMTEPCGGAPDPACVLGSPEKSQWPQPADGKALVFESAPLTEDHVLVGSASVDLWLKSTADDADLEVLISEVRPDGNETYVQGGWLRASQRALAPDASVLRPVKTHLEADAELLPAGEYARVRVEVMPFAQAFRAGSRVRLEISTPGDSRELWRFRLLDYPLAATVEHRVAHSSAHPSSLVLPLIPAVLVPASHRAYPGCPSTRGQACRPHAAYLNAPAD